MKNAINKVTISVDYERPIYDFPALNSEKGNPYIYWKEACSVIRSHGFTKEAELIPSYMKIPYEEQFNYLARYLDFTPIQTVVSEDEQYVYMKVKKDKKDTKQPMLFKVKNLNTLQDLYEAQEDFTITNCYGRNILHYIDNPKSLEFLLQCNKKEQWFSLFDLDNFNSTLLQTHNNYTTFTMLLKAMYEENPELTQKYFTGLNSFGENASGVYLKLLDQTFSKKQISVEDFTQMVESTKIIKLVNPDMYDNILIGMRNTPYFKENKIEAEYLLLETKLEEKSFVKSKLKV